MNNTNNVNDGDDKSKYVKIVLYVHRDYKAC